MQTTLFPNELPTTPYRVLARKYRPMKFDDLIGQETMVKIFCNSIAAERIAHAFLLTGIRGVGKTTTARIMARALNCLGQDGKLTSPATNPCGVCANCTAIDADNHPDVLEIDAASYTGVGDMREIIENVRYRPIAGRYKVYIIDEVHMLSNSAFNALLKTLEEPPNHTKFILATTEIRKVPATILSRCQRFDLKRLDIESLQSHYTKVAANENISIEPSAAALIANAAAGSVRDGLSILDQAIALSEGNISYPTVSEMLGLADAQVKLDLFIEISEGDAGSILNKVAKLYHQGIDPILLLQDMLAVVHNTTRIKILGTDVVAHRAPEEIAKYKELADKFSEPFLNRAWQIISKGIEEVKTSHAPFPALEMVLIRLTYAVKLPSIEELMRRSESANPSQTASGNTVPATAPELNDYSMPSILQLCLQHDELMLHHHLCNDVAIAKFSPGEIVLQLQENAPKTLPRQLQEFLQRTTGRSWAITLYNMQSAMPTYNQQQEAQEVQNKQQILNNPLVQKVLTTFPEMEIASIEPIKQPI